MMRLTCALATCTLLGACSTIPGPSGNPVNNDAPGSDRYSMDQDTPPEERRDISQLPEPVPKNEPLSRYGNPDTYSVWGKTYRVLPSAEGYSAEGLASWYGQKFHGHRTSSGESFDMYRFTAAHRSLPLPTYVRVTNLDNGKSLVVRVNDRGPFHEDRIIDLSWAAAVRLGIEEAGTGRVKVEAISATPAPNAPASKVPTAVRAAVDSPPPNAASNRLFLQAGAFQERDAAERMQQILLDQLGLGSEIRSIDGLHRVWIGPYASDKQRQQTRQSVADAGFERPVPVTP